MAAVETPNGVWEIVVKGDECCIIDNQGRVRHESKGHENTAIHFAMFLAEHPLSSEPNADEALRMRAKEIKREATEEERQKIVSLLKQGKIKLHPTAQDAFARGISRDNHDWTVVSAEVDSFWGPYESNNGGMDIAWATKSAGFGRLVMTISKDGRFVAETEGMSKEFCKEVLAKLVDSWEIRE